MVLLKLNTSKPPLKGTAGSPPPPTPGGSGPKLKLSVSQPPTPASELPATSATPATASTQKKKPSTQRKATGSTQTKKRGANDDISPAAKRLQNATARKPSLSLRAPTTQTLPTGDDMPTPLTAGGLHKIKLGKRKPSIQPRVTIDVKRKIPQRQHAVGYDSEDSETEKDPAVQNGFILRMQPGEDADYLRDAITYGKIGVPIAEGGAQVTLKFIGKDQRRAVVKVKQRVYAAVLVDLPCIVESMKSWDKKGWWKVTDICQMLLVLGLVSNEDEAKNVALPKEVDKSTMQYAHGLTPPMHWVRKRRFRKRITQKHSDDVEARVKELLDADEECEKGGGTVASKAYTREQWERMQYEPAEGEQPYDDELDADGEAIETTEGQTQDYSEFEEPEEEEVDLGDMEAAMQAAFDMDAQAPSSDRLAVSDLVTESPINVADQAASFAAVENSMLVESPAGASTPAAAETPTDEPTQGEEESDEDESDYDEESEADVIDEDAAARAAEKQQQLEEVADLEREIANVTQRAAGMTNQLLRNREMAKLRALEDSLRIKRDAFGLNEE